MLVSRPCANDANVRLSIVNDIVGAGFNPFSERCNALKLNLTTRLGKCGHHHPLGNIFLVSTLLALNTRSGIYGSFRMRDAYA